MESFQAFRRLVLPSLRQSIVTETKSQTSNASTFGLGLSIKEKRQRQQDLETDRFMVEFTLPYNLRSKLHETKFQNSINDWHVRQDLIKNSVQVQCVDTDATSRIPQALVDSVSTDEAKAKFEKTEQSEEERFQNRLMNIKIETLSADPSPLFESMGFEAPFSPPSERDQELLRLESEGGGGGSSSSSAPKKRLTQSQKSQRKKDKEALEKEERDRETVLNLGSSSLDSSSALMANTNNNNNNSVAILDTLMIKEQRDENALALHGAAQELAPWQLKGAPFSEYRRSMYTLGTDSVFSLGGVTRPIRFVSMNFLSFQADALLEKHYYGHLYDLNERSLFSHLKLTEEDAEEAWQRSLHNSKKALEACSTLLHEKSVVAMSLLRRRKQDPERFVMSAAGRASVNDASDYDDRELDIFVRNLRGGFGNVQVVPFSRAGGGKNRIWNRSEPKLAKNSSTSAKRRLDRPFEPVLVICSEGGSSARGSQTAHRLEALPYQNRSRIGDLVEGGNMARLQDHKRIGSSNNNKHVRRYDSDDENNKKVKFHISKTVLGNKNRRYRNSNFTRALVPQKLMSMDSIASQQRVEMKKMRGKENEKLQEAFQDFTSSRNGSNY